MEKEISEILNFARDCIETDKLFKNNYSKLLAPEFNALDFLDLNENKISEILAFFLNPHGKHGHGELFLSVFLDHFNINWTLFNSKDVNVYLEYPTDTKKRIDILVLQNIFEKAIGIENKIYLGTEDQNNQITDYIQFLEKKTKGDFILFYLAPKGKKPSTSSIAREDREKYEVQGKFKIINYEEDIIPLIGKFREKTENERLRYFVRELENKLIKWYIGDSMNKSEDIKNYIIDNNRIEASFSILSALTILKTELKSRFQKELDDLANEMGLKVIKPLVYKPKQWNNHYITFNYESGGLLYGITRKERDPMKKRIDELENILFGIGHFKTSELWPLYAFFYEEIENNSKFYTEINSGEAIEKVKHFFDIIITNQSKLPEM